MANHLNIDRVVDSFVRNLYENVQKLVSFSGL